VIRATDFRVPTQFGENRAEEVLKSNSVTDRPEDSPSIAPILLCSGAQFESGPALTAVGGSS
jgi:hypothetical protein